MDNNNKEIIIDTIEEVLEDIALSETEFKIVADFISFLQTMNLNTFFTKTGIDEIVSDLVKTSDKQDVILDLVILLQTKLCINGLNVSEINAHIKSSVLIPSEATELPIELLKQIKIDNSDSTVSKFMTIFFILRLYAAGALADILEAK